MKKLKIYTLLIAFCLSLGLQAHNPDISSTLLVEKEENTWVLQIRAALTAFEYEVENKFGKNAYSTPEEFNELVLQLVRQRISIKMASVEPSQLQNGMVKLGHETSVTFELNGIVQKDDILFVKNSVFSTISRNKSALIILKKGFSKKQFILDNDNNHSIQLQINNLDIVEVSTKKEAKLNYLMFGLLFSIIASCTIWFFIKKKTTNV